MKWQMLFQTINFSTGKEFFMKPEYQPKLSTSGKMAVALGLAFLGQVSVAANIESVTSGVSVSQQKGVDIVKIAAPNEQGLSHNQYNKFDVSKAGAVMNNALEAGNSQLAGHLAANSNLQGKAASVILNEVVSKNPSLVLGQQEIFGMAADYVLANPNGITYNGGSILNASRASLVVGRPDIQGGSLKAFTVGADGSSKELRVNGVMSGNDVVDLVAPKVVVSKTANLNAGKINMISGSNKVGYTDGSIEKLERAANAPVLDGQVFGAMRAGSIRIHGTDSRATQTFDGANVKATEALNVETQGNVLVRAADLSGGDITIAAKNTTIDGVRSTSRDSFSNQTTEANRVRAMRFGTSKTETFDSSNINATGALNLQNTGDIAINGSNVKAGSLNATAQNFKTDFYTNTNTRNESYNRSKGLWYNNTRTETTDSTVHASTINVKEGAVIDAAKQVSLKAAVLNVGGDAKLSGQEGIVTSGVVETDTFSQKVDFKNETAKLKTGSSSKSSTTQTQRGTQINVGGDLGLVTGKALNTQATTVKAGGSVVVAAQSVNMGATTTTNTNNVNDSLKYWGGIGGGANGVSSSSEQTLYGSSIVAGKDVLLGAKNGVSITGGAVKGATGAFVNAGSVDIRNATTTDTASSSNRTGTIFNITKNRTSNNSVTQQVTGSVLESDADLTVVSEGNVDVVGSSLKAAQKLGIQSAGSLKIAAAQANNFNSESEFSIKGKSSADASLQNGSVSAGIGLVITNQTTNTTSTLNTGSALSGADVELTAKENVTVSGSQVNATNDVNVTATNVEVTAADDVVVTDAQKRVTDIGITGTVSYNGGAPKVGVSAGVSSAFSDTDTTNTTAQVSGITAGNDVNVKATENITHEGTQITAGGDVNQTAQNITNNAAENSSNTTVVKHEGGIGIGASISTAGRVTVEGNIYGQGGKANTTSTTAVVGSVTADNVNLKADNNVTDVATNYQATGDLNVTAQNYNNEAAKNTQTVDSKQGGASIGVSVATSDGQTFDVDAKVGVNYADQHSTASQAVKGNIAANNVNINAADTASVASNIAAAENVSVTATNGVTFTQSQDTFEGNSTNVDVGLSVGAKVHVSGAVAPRGSVSVGVDVANKEATTGSAGTITAGQDIVATAATGTVKVDGANLVAENLVKLEGEVVESNGLTNTRKENGVSVGVSLGGSSTLTETTTTQTTTTTEQHMVKENYCAPPKLVLVENTETTETTEIGTQATGASIGVNVGVKKEDEVSNTANVIIGKGGMTTTPDQVIKEPNTVIKEPDTVIKEPDTVVKEPDTTKVIPGDTITTYDENGSIASTVTLPDTEIVIPGKEVVIPGKEVVIPGKEVVIPGKETIIPGKTAQTGGVIINANSAGNGVSIKGTDITAGVASITNAGGNVHIGSMEGHLNKTNVDVGAAVSVDINGNQVKPNSGSASVTVDLAKNKTYTGSSITATDAVNINAKDNLDLISSTVTAPTVQGTVGGNVNIEAQQDVVNETYVHVGVGVGVPSAGLGETTNKTVEKDVQEGGWQRVETTVETTETTKELSSKAENPQTASNNAAIAAAGTVLQGAQAVSGAVNIADNIKNGEKVSRDDVAGTMSAAAGAVATATKNKVASSIASDLANGSIKGVKANLNIGFDVDKSKTTNETGITANALNLDVGGNISNQAGQVTYSEGTGFGDAEVVHSGSNVDSAKHIDGRLNLTTDIAQNVAYAIEHAQTGKSPVVGGSFSKTAPTTVEAGIQKVAAPVVAEPVAPVVEPVEPVVVAEPVVDHVVEIETDSEA